MGDSSKRSGEGASAAPDAEAPASLPLHQRISQALKAQPADAQQQALYAGGGAAVGALLARAATKKSSEGRRLAWTAVGAGLGGAVGALLGQKLHAQPLEHTGDAQLITADKQLLEGGGALETRTTPSARDAEAPRGAHEQATPRAEGEDRTEPPRRG